jgi:hypothetical protein
MVLGSREPARSKCPLSLKFENPQCYFWYSFDDILFFKWQIQIVQVHDISEMMLVVTLKSKYCVVVAYSEDNGFM